MKHIVEVEKARQGPVYRSVFAADGFPPPIPGLDSCWDVFRISVEKYPGNQMLGRREIVDGKAGKYVWMTYKEVYDSVLKLGGAIRSCGVQQEKCLSSLLEKRHGLLPHPLQTKHMNRSRGQLTNLFQSCTDPRSAAQLHALLLRTGDLADPDCFFATRLTTTYSNLRLPDNARQLFDEIPNPTTFLYNAALRSHSRSHQWPDVLRLFRRMSFPPQQRPDAYTLPIALRACASLSAILPGRAIHAHAIKNPDTHPDMFVAASIIELYAKCGYMRNAAQVLDGFPQPDVVLWTSVVSGYQQNGRPDEAVAFFYRMVVGKQAVPDRVTVVSVVAALTQLGDLRAGKSCHGFMMRMGFDYELSSANSVLNMYAKLGAVGAAGRLFETMRYRDVISWSCMVSCYAHSGNPNGALGVYKKMVESGTEPNSVTVINVLRACALALDLEEGRRVHELAVRKGFELDLVVSTALIDMYMKCSCLAEALELFDRMPKRDNVSWAAVIGGYTQSSLPSESLQIFRRMLLDGMSPDVVIMVKVLAACSQLGVLHQASCFHGYLIIIGFGSKVFVGAALVNLYSKCGCLGNAIAVFKSMSEKDVVLWSSMIAGYGFNGFGKEAIATFKQMIDSPIRPNSITFISVLSACGHAGLVEEGRRIFDDMSSVYGVTPDSEHCAVMVDLLGRSGEFHSALRLIEGMSTPVGPHVWCALLNGCKIHHNIDMGELAAKKLLELESGHAGYYNLLSNIYAFDGRWNNASEIRGMTKEKGLRKTPAHSSVEVGNEVHTFFAGERLHQEWKEICEVVRKLEVKIREEGYVLSRYIEVESIEEYLIGVP